MEPTGRSAPHFLQIIPAPSLFVAPQFEQMIIAKNQLHIFI
ncbi:MAG: hypothetical protein ACTSUT_07425 [Promethearchaeota archaeon]